MQNLLKFFQEYNLKKRAIIGVASILTIMFLILAIIAVLIVVDYIDLNAAFEYKGQTNFVYNNSLSKKFTLSISNDYGNININYNSSISNLFEARIKFYGQEKVTMEDIENFTRNDNENAIILCFNADSRYLMASQKEGYYHILDLQIHPNATVDFDIASSEGKIFLHTNTYNVNITGLDFLTTSGLIDITITNESIIDDNYIELQSNQGEIDFILENKVTIISELVTISTTSGINVTESETYYINNVAWNIEGGADKINFIKKQTNFPLTSQMIEYNIISSSGGIEVKYIIDERFAGVRFKASTTSGEISLPNDSNFYESSNYNMKNIKYDFRLEATTGIIMVK